MNSKYLILILLFAFSQISFSQFFVGANFGMTAYSKAANPVYGPGFGGNISVKRIDNSRNAIGATFGLQRFSSKFGDDYVPGLLPDTFYYSKNLNVFPIGFLYVHYFTEGRVKPYIGADFLFQIFKYSFLYKSDTETQDTYITNGRFTIAPKAGVKVELAAGLHLGFETKLDLVIGGKNSTSKPDYLDEPTFFIQVPLSLGLYYFIAP